jgi:hypothetical protein
VEPNIFELCTTILGFSSYAQYDIMHNIIQNETEMSHEKLAFDSTMICVNDLLLPQSNLCGKPFNVQSRFELP